MSEVAGLALLEDRLIKSLMNALVAMDFDVVRKIDSTGLSEADFSVRTHRILFRRVILHLRRGEELDIFGAASESGMKDVDVMALASNNEFWPAEQLAAKLRVESKEDAARRLIENLKLVPYGALPSGLDEVSGKIKADSILNFPRLQDEFMKVVDRITANRLGTGQYTFHTGIHELDEYTGGLPINLTVLGSLPGAGKSSLVAGICREVCRRGDTVGLLSLEDSRGWIVDRLVSQEAMVPLVALRTRALTNEQSDRVETGMGIVAGYIDRLLVDDREQLSVNDVVASAQRMVHAGAKLIIVDHLGEIVVSRTDRHDLDISEAVKKLRAISKSHNVPVLLVCHLRRREGLDDLWQDPRLTDFAFSSSLERASRLALAVCRDKEERNCLQLHVLKNTSGPSGGKVPLYFNLTSGVVVPRRNDISEY